MRWDEMRWDKKEENRREEMSWEEKRREKMINIEIENNIDYIDRSDYDPNTDWSRMQSYWENNCSVDQCVEMFKKRWL